jgi:hypothetical protein
LPLARGRQRRAGGRAALLRRRKRFLCRCQRGLRAGLLRIGCLECGRIDRLRADPVALVADPGELLLQPAPALLGLDQLLRHGLGTRVRLSRRLGGAVGLRLGHANRFGSLRHGGLDRVGACHIAGIGFRQRRILGGEPRLRRRRIAAELFGVGKVLPELAEPPGRVGEGRAGALLLRGKLLLRDAMAFERGARSS